ncbi:MAG: universal stress protein [Frankiaceae bacterium]|nr:universal stress protein [Frankiaceae bacterium]
MITTAGSGPVVMVAVVGAAETRAAIEWAADYVASRAGTLLLVGTWRGRVHYGLPPFTVTYDPEPGARAALKAAADGVALSPEQIQTELVRGDTGRVLAARSRDVDLLVVGREPGSRVLGSLLGWLGDQCVRRAACPVVVVPVDQHANWTASVVPVSACERVSPWLRGSFSFS